MVHQGESETPRRGALQSGGTEMKHVLNTTGKVKKSAGKKAQIHICIKNIYVCFSSIRAVVDWEACGVFVFHPFAGVG